MPYPASSPHPPRLHTAPPLPALRLPSEPRRHWAGALVALGVHGALVAALFWRGAALVGGGGHGPGPRGGGGGSRPAVQFFALPAFSAPQAFDVPAPPTVAVSEIPLPDPAAIRLPPVDLPKLPVAPAAARGTGTGPGTGGGQGTGTGPGAGSDAGPGTGGEGSYIFRADLKGLIVPPDCPPRGRYQLRFWVAADGRVTDVAIDPLPKDPSCRGDFVRRMKAYKFAPARTRDGQPVASIYPVSFTK